MPWELLFDWTPTVVAGIKFHVDTKVLEYRDGITGIE